MDARGVGHDPPSSPCSSPRRFVRMPVWARMVSKCGRRIGQRSSTGSRSCSPNGHGGGIRGVFSNTGRRLLSGVGQFSVRLTTLLPTKKRAGSTHNVCYQVAAEPVCFGLLSSPSSSARRSAAAITTQSPRPVCASSEARPRDEDSRLTKRGRLASTCWAERRLLSVLLLACSRRVFAYM